MYLTETFHDMPILWRLFRLLISVAHVWHCSALKWEHNELVRSAAVVPAKEIATGVVMPQVMLGMGGPLFGPLHSFDPGERKRAHERAEAMAGLWFSIGGRGLDTAQVYTDEAEAGNAWRESGLSREDVFLLSKFLIPPQGTKSSFVETIDQSLKTIGVDSLDLMLIHQPGSSAVNHEAWQALEEMHTRGRVRAIGISNFNVQQMQALLAFGPQIPPAVNQRSMNVMGQDNANLQFCLDHNITYQAYTPLGDGSVFSDSTVLKIAQAHNKSAAQVALRWVLERGAVLTVQSESAQHQFEDMDLFDFSLSSEEMIQLNALGS